MNIHSEACELMSADSPELSLSPNCALWSRVLGLPETNEKQSDWRAHHKTCDEPQVRLKYQNLYFTVVVNRPSAHVRGCATWGRSSHGAVLHQDSAQIMISNVQRYCSFPIGSYSCT